MTDKVALLRAPGVFGDVHLTDQQTPHEVLNTPAEHHQASARDTTVHFDAFAHQIWLHSQDFYPSSTISSLE
jgi:hypothetical protein